MRIPAAFLVVGVLCLPSPALASQMQGQTAMRAAAPNKQPPARRETTPRRHLASQREEDFKKAILRSLQSD